MANENQTVIVPPKLIGKITPKLMGNPKKAAALWPDDAKESDKRTVLGRILGKARAIGIVTNQDTGEVYESLVGQFGVESYGSGERFKSGRLYLPNLSFLELFKSAFEENKGAPVDISFAYECGVQYSSNQAGFEWFMTDLMPPKVEDDVLSTILAQLPARGAAAPQLEGPAVDPASAATHDKAKTKART